MVIALFAVDPWIAHTTAGELSGNVSVQTRLFTESPLAPGPSGGEVSFSAQPLYYHEWSKRAEYFLFEPFVRIDGNDEERTHVDIRELYWQKVGTNWEVIAGLKNIYWGITESQHLVDIINQTDQVESPDGEDKLGQPMVALTLIRDWGVLDLFALPLFRERTFPGEDGRLRGPLPVNTDHPVYESGARWHHFDWAARWSHTVGDYDIGISHFSGTDRQPRLVPGGVGMSELIPHYDLMNRTGIDLQAIKGDWLLKLEAISQESRGDRHAALVVGFERTFVGISGAADLGVLLEYHYDSRGAHAPTPFENDWFAGGRLALNDVKSSELLAGAIVDFADGGVALFAEASRRVGEYYTVELEYRGAVNVPATDPLYFISADDFFSLQIARYF